MAISHPGLQLTPQRTWKSGPKGGLKPGSSWGHRAIRGAPVVRVAPSSPAPGAQRVWRGQISTHLGVSCGFTLFTFSCALQCLSVHSGSVEEPDLGDQTAFGLRALPRDEVVGRMGSLLHVGLLPGRTPSRRTRGRCRGFAR